MSSAIRNELGPKGRRGARRRSTMAINVIGAGALLVTACASSSDDDGASATTGPATADVATSMAPGETSATTGPATADSVTTTAPVEAFTVNVIARDFAFEGMPDTVPVGTKISLTSAAGGEAHEMAIFKTDNPAEIRGMQHSYWVQAYAGSTDDPGLRLSPETLTEPGHYWYICTLPFGTTNEVFENKRVFENVEPSAAHYSQGMIGEFDVVADS